VISLAFVYDFVPKDPELDARFRMSELDKVFRSFAQMSHRGLPGWETT
jgi:hypothetical protein